ncbi:MAG TPA: VOC family protein [Pyrinomonadaceae bacterium]|jgi:predicted enzyme related to lactoylglutathione lyase
MAEFTIPKHGEICWRELSTQNVDAAKDFYKEMFGWNLEKSKVSEMDYNEIHAGEKAIGGMMPITDCWGENWEKIPPHWMTYVAVENADETIEKIKKSGGGVCVQPFDAPGVGRMSVVNDPSGATFSIIQFISE